MLTDFQCSELAKENDTELLDSVARQWRCYFDEQVLKLARETLAYLEDLQVVCWHRGLGDRCQEEKVRAREEWTKKRL